MAVPHRKYGHDADPDSGSPPGMPRWVKMSAIVVVVLILAAAVVMFLGRGDHGPGRHGSAGGILAGVEAPTVPGDAASVDHSASAVGRG